MSIKIEWIFDLTMVWKKSKINKDSKTKMSANNNQQLLDDLLNGLNGVASSPTSASAGYSTSFTLYLTISIVSTIIGGAFQV